MIGRMLAILLLALIAAACGGSSAQLLSPTTSPPGGSTSTPAGSPGTGSPAAEGAAFCTSLTALRTSFANFAAVVTSGDVTAEQLKKAWDDLKASVDQVRTATGDVRNTSIEDLRNSLDELKSALEALDGPTSTDAKAQQLQTAVQDVITAFREASVDLNCET